MKIYLASSWRNEHYYPMLKWLREKSQSVYDFRSANSAFSWEQVDPQYKMATVESYLANIDHELCEKAFSNDMNALMNCDALVLLMPCGRSAHWGAGYAAGANKPTAIFLNSDKFEPDLMHKGANLITNSLDKLESWLVFTEQRL